MNVTRKRWLKICIGLLSVLLIIDITASFYFYNLVIKRNEKDFLVGNKDLKVSAKAMDTFLEGDWRQWVSRQTFEVRDMQSRDSLKHQGYFLKAKKPTKKTVIFANGYLGRAKDMGLYGQYYYD